MLWRKLTTSIFGVSGKLTRRQVKALLEDNNPFFSVGKQSTPVSNAKVPHDTCCKPKPDGGCAIEEHNGPLAEGWEANSLGFTQWIFQKVTF